MVSSKYLVRDWSVSKDGQNVSFFQKKNSDSSACLHTYWLTLLMSRYY